MDSRGYRVSVLEKAPNLIDDLCTLRRAGLTQTACADACAVRPSVLSSWIAQGDSDIEHGFPDTVYAKLAVEFRKADSSFVAKYMGVIEKKAQDGNWQAAAWLLERTHPESFAESKRLEISPEGNKTQIVVDAPSEEVPKIEGK
jgi:hypothetical protein